MVVVATSKVPVMVVFRAAKEPRLEPPETVRPVVVALLAVMFPKAERLVTLIDPKLAPPVTLNAEVVAVVKVALVADRLPSSVPPLTVSPVVVAFPKLEFPLTPREPNWVPPVTVRLVVVALPKILRLPEMFAT